MSNPGILTIEQRRKMLEDVTISDEQMAGARRYLERHGALDVADMLLGSDR
ncbi:hypothetical protein [Brachybacterium sp. SGAir0954]|uniref:hypothetical protein n=1 Tax=Brachybacterium sp. SGAir0954 TaxID=2571029 RepID=UPI00143DC4B1|nr:hypothetical protein [Brachybacterium sp. SGAir0954]